MGNRIVTKKKNDRSDYLVITSPSTVIDKSHPSLKGVKVRALYTYVIQNSGDLPFTKGDILFVNSDLQEPWWLAKHSVTLQMGYIPSNYVAIDDGSPTSLDSWFDINRAETDKKLLHPGYPEGTYIVRPSAESKNCALSIRHFDITRNFYVVKHYKIKSLDKGGYSVCTKVSFPDIRSLISYYKSNSDGLCCRLMEPFPKQHKPPIQFREIEVNRDCITLEKKLGNGSFGDVWLAKWNNSIEVAVKMLKQNSLDQTQRKCFLEEAKLMHQLHHPRIVEILGVCSEPLTCPVYIITELMSNGALLSFLRNDDGRKLFLKDMILMMNQITEGMAYLESKNFVHRDLRAANILVAEDVSVKVADFGLARVTEDVYEADPGGKFPIKWTAPEAGLRRLFSVKSDIWSFGVLVFEIITYGSSPYSGFQPQSVLFEIERGYRIPNPHGGKINCPNELYNIMLACWDADPEKRPTFSHLRDVFEDYSIATERQYGLNE